MLDDLTLASRRQNAPQPGAQADTETAHPLFTPSQREEKAQWEQSNAQAMTVAARNAELARRQQAQDQSNQVKAQQQQIKGAQRDRNAALQDYARRLSLPLYRDPYGEYQVDPGQFEQQREAARAKRRSELTKQFDEQDNLEETKRKTLLEPVDSELRRVNAEKRKPETRWTIEDVIKADKTAKEKKEALAASGIDPDKPLDPKQAGAWQASVDDYKAAQTRAKDLLDKANKLEGLREKREEIEHPTHNVYQTERFIGEHERKIGELTDQHNRAQEALGNLDLEHQTRMGQLDESYNQAMLRGVTPDAHARLEDTYRRSKSAMEIEWLQKRAQHEDEADTLRVHVDRLTKKRSILEAQRDVLLNQPEPTAAQAPLGATPGPVNAEGSAQAVPAAPAPAQPAVKAALTTEQIKAASERLTPLEEERAKLTKERDAELKRLFTGVHQGTIAPEDAQAQQDALTARLAKEHSEGGRVDSAFQAVTRKALEDRKAGSIDDDTLNHIFEKAGASEKGTDLFTRSQKEGALTPEQPQSSNILARVGSNFARGAHVSLAQIPELAYGAVGLAGELLERTTGKGEAVRNWGFQGYQESALKLEPLSRENDRVETAWKKMQEGDPAAFGDYLEYILGYGAGQIAESVVLALAGGAAGAATGSAIEPGGGTAVGAVGGAAGGFFAKGAAKAFGKQLIEKAVENHVKSGVLKGIEKQGIKMGTREAKKALAARMATAEVKAQLADVTVRKAAVKAAASELGRDGVLLANAAMMEFGSIYPEARKKALAEGREMSGGELAKVLGWGAVATGGEFLGDLIGVNLVTGRYAKMLPKNFVTRVGVGGLVGSLTEGGTEFGQTIAERLGAGQKVLSPEGKSDILNSSLMGFVTGGVGGGGGAAFFGPKKAGEGQTQPAPVMLTPTQANIQRGSEDLAALQGTTPEAVAERVTAILRRSDPATPPMAPETVAAAQAFLGKPITEAGPLTELRDSALMSGHLVSTATPETAPAIESGHAKDLERLATATAQLPAQVAQVAQEGAQRVTEAQADYDQVKAEFEAMASQAPDPSQQVDDKARKATLETAQAAVGVADARLREAHRNVAVARLVAGAPYERLSPAQKEALEGVKDDPNGPVYEELEQEGSETGPTHVVSDWALERAKTAIPSLQALNPKGADEMRNRVLDSVPVKVQIAAAQKAAEEAKIAARGKQAYATAAKSLQEREAKGLKAGPQESPRPQEEVMTREAAKFPSTIAAEDHYKRRLKDLAPLVKSRFSAADVAELEAMNLSLKGRGSPMAITRGGGLIVDWERVRNMTPEEVAETTRHEFKHLAQLIALTPQEVTMVWDKLGESKEGQEFQRTSRRAYRISQVTHLEGKIEKAQKAGDKKATAAAQQELENILAGVGENPYNAAMESNLLLINDPGYQSDLVGIAKRGGFLETVIEFLRTIRKKLRGLLYRLAKTGNKNKELALEITDQVKRVEKVLAELDKGEADFSGLNPEDVGVLLSAPGQQRVIRKPDGTPYETERKAAAAAGYYKLGKKADGAWNLREVNEEGHFKGFEIMVGKSADVSAVATPGSRPRPLKGSGRKRAIDRKPARSNPVPPPLSAPESGVANGGDEGNVQRWNPASPNESSASPSAPANTSAGEPNSAPSTSKSAPFGLTQQRRRFVKGAQQGLPKAEWRSPGRIEIARGDSPGFRAVVEAGESLVWRYLPASLSRTLDFKVAAFQNPRGSLVRLVPDDPELFLGERVKVSGTGLISVSIAQGPAEGTAPDIAAAGINLLVPERLKVIDDAIRQGSQAPVLFVAVSRRRGRGKGAERWTYVRDADTWYRFRNEDPETIQPSGPPQAQATDDEIGHDLQVVFDNGLELWVPNGNDGASVRMLRGVIGSLNANLPMVFGSNELARTRTELMRRYLYDQGFHQEQPQLVRAISEALRPAVGAQSNSALMAPQSPVLSGIERAEQQDDTRMANIAYDLRQIATSSGKPIETVIEQQGFAREFGAYGQAWEDLDAAMESLTAATGSEARTRQMIAAWNANGPAWKQKLAGKQADTAEAMVRVIAARRKISELDGVAMSRDSRWDGVTGSEGGPALMAPQSAIAPEKLNAKLPVGTKRRDMWDLAAAGFGNAEIAEAMNVSETAVASTLYRVRQALGVEGWRGPRKLAPDESGLSPRMRKVFDLFQAGQRPAEIARQLGISNGSVKDALKEIRQRLGDEIAPREKRGRPTVVDWTKIDWTQTDTEIAAQTGVIPASVMKQRQRHAPSTRRGPGKMAVLNRIVPPGTQRRKILDRWRQGASASEIADEIAATESDVESEIDGLREALGEIEVPRYGAKDRMAALKRMGVSIETQRAALAWWERNVPLPETARAELGEAFRRSQGQEQALSAPYAGISSQQSGMMSDSLETAKAMAAAGKNSEEIRAVTGWFPGKYDGKMRYELPSEGVQFKTNGWMGLNLRTIPVDDSGQRFYAYNTLEELLDHPALFKAYPEARDINVTLLNYGEPGRAQFQSGIGEGDLKQGSIALERAIVKSGQHKAQGEPWPVSEAEAEQMNAEERARGNLRLVADLQTLIHEIQHWVQEREGFAQGGRPDPDGRWSKETERVADELSKSMGVEKGYSRAPYEAYRRRAGEIEARDASARMNYTAEQRAAIAPYSSENIAKEDAIVMFGDKGQALSAPESAVSPEGEEFQAAVDRKDVEAIQRLGTRHSGLQVTDWRVGDVLLDPDAGASRNHVFQIQAIEESNPAVRLAGDAWVTFTNGTATRFGFNPRYDIYRSPEAASRDGLPLEGAGRGLRPLPFSGGPQDYRTSLMAPQSPIVTDGFYSQLERVIADKLPNNATAAQAKGLALKNAKPDEVKWSGVLPAIDRLASENGGKIPKAALLAYLRDEGRVRFEEVTYGQGTIKAISAKQTLDQEWLVAMSDGSAQVVMGRDTAEDAMAAAEALNEGGRTRWADKTVPGGREYREVVLAMGSPRFDSAKATFWQNPEDGTWQAKYPETTSYGYGNSKEAALGMLKTRLESGEFKQDAGYRSSHFPDVPNYVAHYRADTREDSRGKTGTHVATVQSDRHQAARQFGYRGTGPYSVKVIGPEHFDIVDGNGKHAETWTTKDYAEGRARRLNEELTEPQTIPDAPFRKTKEWVMAIMKRVIRDAVASNHDWVGWDTGATQSERWQSSEGDLTPLYDQIIPEAVGAYVKQWGGKVEKASLTPRNPLSPAEKARFDQLDQSSRRGETTEEEEAELRALDERGAAEIYAQSEGEDLFWRVDITPAMRESVAQGQALFAPQSAGTPEGEGSDPKSRVDAVARIMGEVEPGVAEMRDLVDEALWKKGKLALAFARHWKQTPNAAVLAREAVAAGEDWDEVMERAQWPRAVLNYASDLDDDFASPAMDGHVRNIARAAQIAKLYESAIAEGNEEEIDDIHELWMNGNWAMGDTAPASGQALFAPQSPVLRDFERAVENLYDRFDSGPVEGSFRNVGDAANDLRAQIGIDPPDEAALRRMFADQPELVAQVLDVDRADRILRRDELAREMNQKAPRGMPLFAPQSPVSAEEDARYLELARDPEGNKAELQRMVDEAARKAMPDSVVTEPAMSSKERLTDKPLLEVFHGTNGEFTAFERGRVGVTDYGFLGVIEDQRHGIFFAENREFASTFAKSKGGSRIIAAFLNIRNPFTAFDAQDIVESRELGGEFTKDFNMARWFWNLRDKWEAFDGEKGQAFVEWLEGKGYDGAYFSEDPVGLSDTEAQQSVWVALSPNQIKSADPVTYDSTGAAIPLSQRFNPASDSILQAPPAPGSGGNSQANLTPDPDFEAFLRELGVDIADLQNDPTVDWSHIAQVQQSVAAAAANPSEKNLKGLEGALNRWLGVVTQNLVARPMRAVWESARDRFPETIRMVEQQILPPGVTVPEEAMAVIREHLNAIPWGKVEAGEYAKLLTAGGTSNILGFTVPKTVATPENQKKLFDAITGRAPVASLPTELQPLANRVKRAVEEVGRQHVEAGLLKQETFDRQRGDYLPRVYTEKELADRGFNGWVKRVRSLRQDPIHRRRSDAFCIIDSKTDREVEWDVQNQQWRFDDEASRDAFFKNLVDDQTVKALRGRFGGQRRITLAEVQHPDTLDPKLQAAIRNTQDKVARRYELRRPLTDDELKARGMVFTPGYPVAKALIEGMHRVQVAKLFNRISANQDWALPAGTQQAPDGFVRMPDDRTFGVLRGRFVQEDIARTIRELGNAVPDALALYDGVMSTWKYTHTVLNPATHGRNFLGNAIFSDLAGVAILNPLNWHYYQKATRLLRGEKVHSVLLAELYDQGVLGHDFSRDELKGLLSQANVQANPDNPMAGLWNLVQGAKAKVERLYQLEDDLFKTAAYIRARHAGMTPLQASQHVRKWMTFYDNIPQSELVRWTKRTGKPFMSFQYEAVRILMVNGSMEAPFTMLKWAAIPALITLYSFLQRGYDDRERKAILAEMRGRKVGGLPLFSMLLPDTALTRFFDKSGNPVMWDLTNVFPQADWLGDRVEADRRDQQETNMERWLRAIVAGNPFSNAIVSLALNKNTFTGQQIRKTGERSAIGAAADVASTLAGGPRLSPWADKIPILNGTSESQAQELWNAFAPSLVTKYGALNRTKQAITGEKSTTTFNKRTEVGDVARSWTGVDIRKAMPTIYRIVDRWAASRNKPLEPEFGGDSTERSRAVKDIYQALVNANTDDLANAIQGAKETGLKIETPKAIQDLVKRRHPLSRVNMSDRQQFRADITELERKAVDQVIAEHQKVFLQAPAMLGRALAKLKNPAP